MKDTSIIFGAAGFVGTYLVDELPKDSFLAIDSDFTARERFAKQKMQFVCRDITKSGFFEFLPNDISCVINLASLQPARVCAIDPIRYIEVNTIGAINIAKYCVDKKIPKLIHIVSHRGTMLDYSDAFAEFAISEMAAVQMIHCYREKHSLQAIILRIPAVFGYGPHLEGYIDGQRQKTGFQTFIDNALLGKPLEVWGNPYTGRDIVYVKDVVSAIVMAMESRTADGLYNIASGEVLTLDEEAKAINDVFSPKKKGSITYKPEKKNGIKECHYNISKAFDDFGWFPKYSFRDMLVDYKKEWHNGRFNFLLGKE